MLINNAIVTGSLAVTGNSVLSGSLAISGSITTTGNITAQTLVVQTVTSSVIYSSGSNVFGNNIANTQVMTGSVTVTGSLAVVTNGTEFQVNATGVNLGNALIDSHIISGSVRINPNGLFVSSSGLSIFGGTSTTSANPTVVMQNRLGTVLSVAGFNWAGTTTDNNSVNSLMIIGGYLNTSAQTVATATNASGMQFFNGGFYWYGNSGLTVGNVYTNTQRMFLTVGGNLIIGSGSDGGFRLDVGGTARLTGALTATSATFAGSVVIRPSTGYNALFQVNGTNFRTNYLNDAQDTNISAQYRATNFTWQDSAGATTFNIASAGTAAFSGSLTMGAYSFADSAIQFRRANTNTISPGGGNGILVFAGGNAQMRIDTANGICFDMNNGGSPYAVLKLQQNGNTVLVDSPNNTLSLGLGYQGTYHGFLGGFSSRLEAFSTNGGYVFLNSSNAWVAASDRKRKRNFETYSVGLNAIIGLQPKLYNMDFQEDGDEKQLGLIAQEVKELIPLAYNDSEGFIGLDYNSIIVTMINAIKELKAEIDELKNK